MSKNLLFPISEEMVTREEKEEVLKQRAKVIWLTGLSGSGKSTLAKFLERKLFSQGFLTKMLDGDNLRSELNGDLGFSDEDRTENVRRMAVVAKMFKDCGVVTICSLISPKKQMRSNAKAIIGTCDFLEVYVKTAIEECERRDVKGLYQQAKSGKIASFTGLESGFEIPEHPRIEIETENNTVEESGTYLYRKVLPFLMNSTTC